jgi:phospholipase C
VGCGNGTAQPGRKAPFPGPHGIHLIQHVVVIMEENRSVGDAGLGRQ